jgi:hypothetical protein
MRSMFVFFSGALVAACASNPGTSQPVDVSVSETALSSDTPLDNSPLDVRSQDAMVVSDVTIVDVQVAPDASTDIAQSDAIIDVTVRDALSVDAADAATATDVSGDAPSFGSIYQDILRPRCASCHDRAGGWGGQFRMPDPATAYRELVNVRAATTWVQYCDYVRSASITSPLRVRPGDPAASLLSNLPGCYIRDADHMRMTEGERETVRAWIAAGAPASGF